MTELLLGIDIGTTNTKAVLATPDGDVRAQAWANHATHRSRSSWAEQSPADWWQGTAEAIRRVVGEIRPAAGQIAGIGVSGQGCGVTLIDRAGAVVRPAIIWMDARSEEQCEKLRHCCAQQILDLNGKQPAPYNADPVLMWLQEHEPEAIARAQTSLTTTGYINLRLTGKAVANQSDASILFAFDLARGDWSDELIDAFGLPRRLYPPVAACSDVIGRLGRDAAADLGLAPGIPVIAGGEDTSSAGLSIGTTQPGQAFLSLGTAGTIYIVEEKPIVDAQLLAFLHVLPNQRLLGGSMVAVGGGLNWVRTLLGDDLSYQRLDELAAQSRPGAGDLIFLPYLSGELQPINDGHARGVFFGLSLSTERADIVRSVMEGAAFAITHNIVVAREAGSSISELRAVGGPTQSEVWCQIIADVTGCVVAVLADNAGAPRGNALLAAAGVGLIADAGQAAQASARVTRRYEPDRDNHARYLSQFAIYRDLYPQLKGSFANLSRLPELGARMI